MYGMAWYGIVVYCIPLYDFFEEKLASEAASFDQRAGQLRAGALELEERLAAKSRELDDARQQVVVLKAAATQVVAFQTELESTRLEKNVG